MASASTTPFYGREHELQRLQELARKKTAVSSSSGVDAASALSMPRHMSYRPVLIHAGAMAESIAEQEYFSSLIDFGELMTSSETST